MNTLRTLIAFAIAMLASVAAYSAISDNEVYLLNNKFSPAVANKVQLGTKIRDAETSDPADGAISLEHLDSGITCTHRVVAAGEFTTVGGDASESITAAAVVATDVVSVTLMTVGATPRTILTANSGTGAIAVTMSGDPSTDHVLQYVVFRACS